MRAHINDQREDGGFLRIWLQVQTLYVHYKIGCFILLFDLCAYNAMQHVDWTFIYMFAPYASLPSRQLFVAYKTASNVNAEMALLRVLLL